MATVPSQRTWVAAETPTAAHFNTNVRDAVNFLLSPPRCRAFQGAAQTLTTATLTAVTLDSEDTDTGPGGVADPLHSTAVNTSRMTIVTPGRYRVIASSAFASNATGYRECTIKRTGTTVAQSRHQAANGGVHIEQCVDEVLCVAGDYIEMFAAQSSGGNLALIAGTANTFLHVVWVSTT